MRVLSAATLLAALASLAAAQDKAPKKAAAAAPAAAAAVPPAGTMVPQTKPTLGVVVPTVKFVDPPAAVQLNVRDVPIEVAFANVGKGEEVGGSVCS